jgi:hypothetical protein
MEFSVRHSMPGRVRLNIPALSHKRSLGEALLAWISGQSGIKSARINYDCASLVLEYDPAHEPLLRTLLERFQNIGLAGLKSLVASSQTVPAQASANPAPPAVSKRSPLALPTLSLLMAFSANPVVVGINMPLMLWNAWPIAKRAWNAGSTSTCSTHWRSPLR